MSTISGVVKSYNPLKGFGFLVSGEVEGDVYFQQRDLPPALQFNISNLVDCYVSFELRHAPDGKPQAKNVQVENEQAILATDTTDPAKGVDISSGEETYSGEVKSYNELKGFGFLTSGYVERDVYFQKRDVPMHMQSLSLVGYTANFSTHQTPDGNIQARNLTFTGGNGGGASPGAGGGGCKTGGLISPMVGRGAMGGSMGGGMGMYGGMGGMGGMGCMAGMAGMGGMGGMGGKGMMWNSMWNVTGPPDGAGLTGVVKSFDERKGFGFLGVPGFPMDVYFKPEAPVETGESLSFTLKWSPDGRPQARNMKPALVGGELLVGTIKSYGEKTRYGFLTVPDIPQDIYFQQKDLPEDMQAMAKTDLYGSTVRFTVNLQNDGKPCAADIAFVAGPPQGTKRPGGGVYVDDEEGDAGADDDTQPSKKARVVSGLLLPGVMSPGLITPRAVGMFAGGVASVRAAALPAGVVQMGGVGTVETVEGHIKSFNVQNGYGFIQSSGVSGDVYFKSTMLPVSCQDPATMGSLVGAKVDFELRYLHDGRPQAGNIQVAGM